MTAAPMVDTLEPASLPVESVEAGDLTGSESQISSSTGSDEASLNDDSSDTVQLVFDKIVGDTRPTGTGKFRVNFMRKLSDHKVWVPPAQRPPKHQSVIIFDWDDTLMYTSFLVHGRDVSKVPPQIRHQLETIEMRANDLLHKALELGQTFIITNAQVGWVEDCVQRYMPSLKAVLERVPVISARSAHQAEHPHLSQWKKVAFMELGRRLDKQLITNLVSVGDSNFEMEAARLLSQEFPLSLIKTVKLQECPSPEELMKELDLVVPKFQHIVEKGISMKIKLERRTR